jgi:glycosyltransferase involved in cell wall biosynthesis
VHFVIATPYFPSAADPTAGTFIERQARALAARGHRVDVIHLQPRPLPLRSRAARWRARAAVPPREQVGGLEVFRTGYPSTIQRSALRRFQAAAIARSVGRLLAREPVLARADVLYAQWLVPFGYGCLRAARRAGIPCMAIARGGDLNLWGEVPALRRQLLRLVERVDALLGNGEYVDQELARLAGRPLGRPVEVVYNPCDLTPFLRVDRDDPHLRTVARQALGLPPTVPLLLFLGQLDARKGPDTAVEALARLPAAWHLIVAGAGDLERRLAAQAAALGVADRVRLLGPVPHRTAPVLMSACDVLALPSRRDGLANVLVEALAAEMPVVATPTGGAREVILPGRTGWLVAPERPGELAGAVAAAHRDPSVARAQGRAGRALVGRLFDLERNLGRLEAIAGRLALAPAGRA